MAAVARDDFEAAEVCFRRMEVLDESARSTIFGQAILAARQSDSNRARSLMQQVAPADSGGIPQAHFWLALDIIEQEAELSPQSQRTLEHHLKQALAVPHLEVRARYLLSRLYMSKRDARNAIAHLERLLPRKPELGLMLAQLYASLDRMHSARTASERAAEFFQQQAKTEPDQPRHRIRWACCETLQNNCAQAVAILETGLASSDPRPFRNALAATYLKWHVNVVQQEDDNLAKQLELLNRALIYAPNDALALTLLADLATRRWERADLALAALQEALAEGKAPATVHMVLGTRALEQGDLDNARIHLELANDRNPQMPLVLNNLAWVLAQQQRPDLPRALQMAEASRRLSDHPQIHHTLGTILSLAGRHREAIAELEVSLRGLPGRSEIHGQLATLYERLGDFELAEQHRRLEKRVANEFRTEYR